MVRARHVVHVRRGTAVPAPLHSILDCMSAGNARSRLLRLKQECTCMSGSGCPWKPKHTKLSSYSVRPSESPFIGENGPHVTEWTRLSTGGSEGPSHAGSASPFRGPCFPFCNLLAVRFQASRLPRPDWPIGRRADNRSSAHKWAVSGLESSNTGPNRDPDVPVEPRSKKFQILSKHVRGGAAILTQHPAEGILSA